MQATETTTPARRGPARPPRRRRPRRAHIRQDAPRAARDGAVQPPAPPQQIEPPRVEPPQSPSPPLVQPAVPVLPMRAPATSRTAPQGPSEGWLIFVGALVVLAVIREGVRRAREHPIHVTRSDSAAAALLAREGLRQIGSAALGTGARSARS